MPLSYSAPKSSLPIVVLLLALGFGLLAQPAVGATPAARKKTVTMVIDYGDGVEKHFTRLPWRKGMTVFGAMKAASAHPRGIQFEHRGKGATAFLLSIDKLENEGTKRNWIFRVNGKLADCSFGIAILKAGDTILWKFGEYR